MLRARSVAATTIAWTIGAASSIAIGLTAITMIGAGLNNEPLQPFSPNASEQPGQETSEKGDPSPSAIGTAATAATPVSTGPVHTVSTTGGSAFIQCVQSGAYIYGWAPAPGYHIDDLRRGPAAQVRITFQNTLHEVTMSAHCTGDTVQPTIQNDDSGPGT